MSRRRIIVGVVIVVAIVGFIVFVLPQISNLSATLKRLRSADPLWIAAGVAFETLSLAGYVWLFRAVFSCQGAQIGLRESAQITLAGTVASKLLAAAGAGGVALTVWALRAAGLSPRAITRRMITFEVLLYTVFAAALIVFGFGLRTGALAGNAPWTLTVVPGVLGTGAVLGAAILWALPSSRERRIAEAAEGRREEGRVARLTRNVLHAIASAPRVLREATTIIAELVRDRELGLLGAVVYWALDIATLWAALHAFGQPPPIAPIVMAYFVGQLANVIPLPGGVGGVEGGMIGTLIAFGASGSLAVLGVIAYRLVSFWLPTVPGGIAYLRLRQTVAGWREAHPSEPDPAAAADGAAELPALAVVTPAPPSARPGRLRRRTRGSAPVR